MMDVTELHDEENLLVQMQDRWENYGSLDAIVDTHDPFTLEGAPRFELADKINSLLNKALTEDENLLLRQTLGMGCKQRSVKSLAQQMGTTQKAVQKQLVLIVEKLRQHDDSIGLWADFIDRRTLIIPLDTHVLQQSVRLGLLSSKTATMSTAKKLTDSLSEIFPDDPLKGDFALFGYGVNSTIANKIHAMLLKVINKTFTVCKVTDYSEVDLMSDFVFIGKTDGECSLVCETSKTPSNTIERNDGWRAFRIEGILDFSLIGILSKISKCLADNGIGIFAISTFNTDYILTKAENFEKAIKTLEVNGYEIAECITT